MEVYLGKCHPRGDFHARGVREFTLESTLYGVVHFFTDQVIQVERGKLALMASVEKSPNGVPYQPCHVAPFFCGQKVRLMYDIKTHEVVMASIDKSQDSGVWCVSSGFRFLG